MNTAIAISTVSVVIALVACLLSIGANVKMSAFLAESDVPSTGELEGSMVGKPPPAALFRDVLADEATEWTKGPAVVLFTSASCGACRDLLSKSARRPAPARVLVVEAGNHHEDTEQDDQPNGWRRLTDVDGLWMAGFGGLPVFPHAHLVVDNLVVESVVGTPRIERLFAGVVAGQM
jgi:hypothetical protein